MTTRTHELENDERLHVLTGRRSRECPLEGPSSIISGVVRHALEVGDLDEAEAVLNTAVTLDRNRAQAEVLALTNRIVDTMAEAGFHLTEEQQAALIIAGPEIYLEGLYQGRIEGAKAIKELQRQGE